MKKALSVLLALLIVLSSMTSMIIGVSATEAENLLKDISAEDWTSGWNGSSGEVVEDGIAVRAAWRSAYTKVTLIPDREYTLSFSFAQVRVSDVRVFPASEITDVATQLTSSNSGGHVSGGTTNLASDTITSELTSGTPIDGKFYSASETFKTNSETEYYIILDCNEYVTTSVVLRAFSLVAQPKTVANPNEEIANPANWKGTRGATFTKATDVKNNTAGVTASGTMEWGNSYAIIPLSANTDYNLSFSYKGAAKITSLYILAKKDCTYTSGQYVYTQKAEGAEYCATHTMKNITPSADSWVDISVSFKTNDDTQYYFIFDHNVGTGFTISNFNLEVIGTEQVITDPTSWKGTRGATFTKATDVKNNTAGVTASGTMEWGNSYAIIPLSANTDYNLSFSYKGAAKITSLYILAEKDCTYTSGQYVYTQKADGAEYCATHTMSSVTPSADSWVDISVSFKTNDDTQYYFIFDHNVGTGFTISDFSITAAEIDDTANVLGNTVASDWTSSWDGATGSAYKHNAVKAAWHSAYTNVALKADATYDFSFSGANVKVSNIRVYAASEITDASTQLKNSADRVQGGTNNLVTSFISGAPTDDFSTAEPNIVASYYNYFATFTTGTDTEYYIIVDGGQFNESSGTNLYFKNLSLTEQEKDPNLLGAYTYAKWKTNGRAVINAPTDSYSGDIQNAFSVTKLMWRSAYTTVKLEESKAYTLSFYYKEDAPDNVWLAKGKEMAIAPLSTVDTTINGSELPVKAEYNLLRNADITPTDKDGWYKVNAVLFPTTTAEYIFTFNGASVDVNDTALIHFSDFSLEAYDYNTVTVESKNNATINPVNGCDYGYALSGLDYSFKVVTEPGLTPSVTVNGVAVTADQSGVYSVLADSDLTIGISCGEADEGRPDADKDYEGNDLTRYNPELYLKNIWEGDTVYHETAMFYTGRETVKLLYPVDEVISLRSYGLDVLYIKGVDYDITEDGLIKILEGSRIPVYTDPLTTTTKPSSNAFPLRDNSAEWLVSIGDTVYPKYAISVTYKHSTTFEEGYAPTAPESQTHKLATTVEKLKNGETVNVVIYGDSISSGWSSSGLDSKTVLYAADNSGAIYQNGSIYSAPYAPTWMDMVITELKAKYPAATINVINLSLPGMASGWGASNIAARLALWKDENGNQITPDLLMVGFGVNDAYGDIATATFKSNMKTIADNARTASGNSELEVLYYSPFLPNQNTEIWDEAELLEYESALVEIADTDADIGVLKLTSVFAEIVDSKEAIDYLNTNWNHGNDFTARQYATGILAALTEPEYTPGDIDDDGAVNLNDLVTIAQYVAEWDVKVNTAALDINGDNTVDLNDVVHLSRYLAGWDGYTLN